MAAMSFLPVLAVVLLGLFFGYLMGVQGRKPAPTWQTVALFIAPGLVGLFIIIGYSQ